MNIRKSLIGIALCAFTLVAAVAQDCDTNPDVYFLHQGDVANSTYILPPPPAVGSAAWLHDQERYAWGKEQRQTARGDQAVSDARVSGDGVANAFSDAFGMEISRQNTPRLYDLLHNMREDAGDLATRDAKNHYNRTRPFVEHGEDTCNPEDQAKLSVNGSYPSGHSAIGWATALVLAEINPDRQNEIFKRGYEMGQSRVICGYHYQSDVDAGRLCAAMAVARLHASPQFMAKLEAAKNEFKLLTATQAMGQ